MVVDNERAMEGSNKSSSRMSRQVLDTLPASIQFAILGSGVFLFFGIHNILQEAMMKIPGFNFGVMLGYMEVFG
jgi:solute carrier family 35 (adenosine 3'-phospho 5'-phosphosulfate transporter), member B3